MARPQAICNDQAGELRADEGRVLGGRRIAGRTVKVHLLKIVMFSPLQMYYFLYHTILHCYIPERFVHGDWLTLGREQSPVINTRRSHIKG